MAKVFLSKDETFNAANDNLTIFGGAGNEAVTIMGVGITVDQNVEQVNFGSDLYNFKFLQAGNLLKVFNVSGTILIATIPVQQDGTVLSFAGETFNATLSNSAVMQIGDVVIGSNITAVTPPQFISAVIGDTLNFGSTNLIIHSVLNNVPIQAGMAEISSTGLATFNAADNDLSSKLTSVESALSKDGATVGGAAVFVDSDASYLFVSDSIAGVTNNDVLVKLQGASASLTGFDLPAPATTLTFNDLDSSNGDNNPIAMGYGGLDWGGTSQIGVVSKAFLVADNTYSDTSVTHSDAVAFNYWGNTTSVEAIGGGTFDFTSAAWCSAWGDKQNLSFEGWSGDTELYSSDTNPITSSATTIALNWKGIDKLVIDGGGSQWLMDNFIYQKSAVYVGSSISFDSSTLLSVNDVKLVDTTPPTPAILSPALVHGDIYAENNKLTISFSEPVKAHNLTIGHNLTIAHNLTIDQLILEPTSLDDTPSFGGGATITPVNADANGFASSFTLTLGTSPSIVKGDEFLVNAGVLIDIAGNVNSVGYVFNL